MTKDQKTGFIRNTRKGRHADRETREVSAAYWGASAIVLSYLTFLCAVKEHSFALVGIGTVAVLLGALVSKAVAHFAD